MRVPIKSQLFNSLRSARSRLHNGLAIFARGLGFLGMLALGACAVYAWLPDLPFPPFLERRLLTMYTCMSLLASSFLGWSCMQVGMQDLKTRTGTVLGCLLLVVLPLVGFAVVEFDVRGIVDSRPWPHGEHIYLFALWYPWVVMGASLLAYVGDRSEHRGRIRLMRALGAFTLIAPYVMLTSWLILELPLPLQILDEGLQEVIHQLGSTTVLLQIMLAFFFGTTGGP